MKILVTGATGFVGRALVARLARDGHEITAWVRNPQRARGALGRDPSLLATGCSDAELIQTLEQTDAVINLAGEPIFVGRWSAARKEALVRSRTETTARLVQAMGAAQRRPRVLINASAVGYYGATGDESLDEKAPAGGDFLARLCEDWELEAKRAQAHDIRVAILRIGIVLGTGGGALAKMLPPFQMGAGGRLGSGRQWMSWIHLHDLVELIATAVTDERYAGVFNATAPQPVTNRAFAAALGSALRRPAVFPVPGMALRLLLGEAADALLTGQRVVPKRAEALGFAFQFSTVAAALGDILAREGKVNFSDDVPENPTSVYLKTRKARHCLHQRAVLHAPLDEVLRFFGAAENLGAMTPPNLSFEMRTPPPEPMEAGAIIDYKIGLGPLPLKWRTEIESWSPPARFVDVQLQGPYACWWHEHRFIAEGDRTVMEDRVYYRVPGGPLGRLIHALFVRPQLKMIFGHRADYVRLRFGPRREANTNGRQAA